MPALSLDEISRVCRDCGVPRGLPLNPRSRYADSVRNITGYGELAEAALGDDLLARPTRIRVEELRPSDRSLRH